LLQAKIVDDDYINTGEAASPMAEATWVTPAAYRLPPATPQGDSVATQISYWVGYQDLEDSGTGGSSLAQVGVVDNLYTASTGGAFYSLLEPFAEFAPDPPTILSAMTIQAGDTVSFILDYAGSSTFSFTAMDSNALGTTSISGTVNL